MQPRQPDLSVRRHLPGGDAGGFERIQQVSLRDRVVTAIRDAIVQGRLRPGEKVPEHHLAEQLGVSRTPIREAIAILEQQRLVVTVPKRGTYIASVDRGEVADALAVRIELEQLAARQAIDRLSLGDWEQVCSQLGEVVAAMEEAVERRDPVMAAELDIRFHTILIESARNRFLSETWRIAGLPVLIWSPDVDLYPQTAEHWEVWYPQRHGELLDALRSGDPASIAEPIRAHISIKLQDLDRHYSTHAEEG